MVAVGMNLFFVFNATHDAEIFTLSLHDALPILRLPDHDNAVGMVAADHVHVDVRDDAVDWHGRMIGEVARAEQPLLLAGDRKSTRLNSSHSQTSYAVFCLKKKSR